LRSLQGMQQFSALVTLAAADNLIDSFDQLEFLTMAAQAHTLRALSLEGNPIARLPNYRLPSLNGCIAYSPANASAVLWHCQSGLVRPERLIKALYVHWNELYALYM